ncbi:hypothetical protein RCO48_32910 [Peribacillus frigoritolerans]|nr:hypothetical protein [Peribacillus frigoritolerans]
MLKKVIRAVARAHHKTGVPYYDTFRSFEENGLLQVQIFEEEGVDLSKVLIGHSGDTNNLGYLEILLEKRCFYWYGPLWSDS